jgi:nicotinate-nucleotide adenylyltransferase
MRIGIYGGTFDPIHHGHLILARDAMEVLDLDRLIFVPNVVSPHKISGTPINPELRLAMVYAAIEDESGLECDPAELERGGTSFTIDTVLHMHDRFPGEDFFLLIGADNLPKLHTWRRIEELERLATFVILTRGDDSTLRPYPVLPRQIDISATEIRERVAKGLSIRYLVPDRVREIIEENALYLEDR